MLLSIEAERTAIQSEMLLVQRIRYKLSNQMRHFKEFNQIKLMMKLIDQHLQQLACIEQYNLQEIESLVIEPYLQANQRIKNHILRKGHQVKQLLSDAIFIPYATLAFGCLSKISFNL